MKTNGDLTMGDCDDDDDDVRTGKMDSNRLIPLAIRSVYCLLYGLANTAQVLVLIHIFFFQTSHFYVLKQFTSRVSGSLNTRRTGLMTEKQRSGSS